jgi:uncharacterized protein YodC (DUF2158 family)
MRLLLLAVLALAAVAVGAAGEPHGGCDYDFGAGNGTAYLVVNNPYNFVLSLNITYQSGEHKYSEVRSISNTRVIVFCGLGHGWLYIRQNASPLRSPLALYPLAVPRYVVLRAGESATMSVTTLFAPAVTIAAAFLLLVAFTLRPRLRQSAVYALPDALRDENILIVGLIIISIVAIIYSLFILLFIPLIGKLSTDVSDVSNDPLTELMILSAMYITLSLGGFYLSFRRRLWTYYYLLIIFLINLLLCINYSKSLLSSLLFILSVAILLVSSTILFTSSIALLSFYNLFMVSFLSAYGIATFIYYDANFGRPITWSLPLQIPAIIPEIWVVVFPIIVAIAILFLFAVIVLTYSIDIIRGMRTVAHHAAFWPPLWWWFGLGVFALDELAARSLLHRLSASGGVVVELSRGGKAIVVSADLYGMYLCRFGGEGGVCKDVEWVRYGEVKFRISKIIKSRERRSVFRFIKYIMGRCIRKVVLPILAGILAYFTIKNIDLLIFLIAFQLNYYKYIIVLTYSMIKYVDLLTILTFLLFLIVLVFVYYKYNDFRELKEYMMSLDKDTFMSLFSLLLFSFSFIIPFSASEPAVLYVVTPTAIAVTFLLRADPKLSRYLFPGLELRLMCVDGSVVALARGGCLQWAKVGVAPQGSALVIRDGDCLVVVSPYVDNVRSRLQRYLCGPACPPVRVVGGEGVAVGVLDLQRRRYYYYVVDSSR